MKKRFKGKPPNWRPSQSCGTCKFGEWGYEGELECLKYPDNYSKAPDYGSASWMVCDKWEQEAP